MTRRTNAPPDAREPSQGSEELERDNLVELPITGEPPSAPGERLAREPQAIAAWLDHASDPALADRLAELAQELAEGPQPATAPRRRRRWPIVIAIAAAAAVLLSVSAAALWLRPAPQPEPPVLVQPVVPHTLPMPTIEPSLLAQPELPPTPSSAGVEPTPAVQPQAPRRPAQLEPRTLVSTDPSTPLPLLEGVEVLLDGQLAMSGTANAPRLSLRGSAIIDVVPGSVDSLELTSVAARVQVLGTRFAVEEGEDHTTVSVERGRVAAHCQAGQTATLEAGEELNCPNANSLLIQAKLLRIQGAPADEVLPIVQAGLSFPDFQLRERLEVMAMELLLELDRGEEASVAIQNYLARPSTQHRDEVERLAERLAPSP